MAWVHSTASGAPPPQQLHCPSASISLWRPTSSDGLRGMMTGGARRDGKRNPFGKEPLTAIRVESYSCACNHALRTMLTVHTPNPGDDAAVRIATRLPGRRSSVNATHHGCQYEGAVMSGFFA
nr:hypothetical protein CFP56_12259 [Quercus suber]